MRTAIAGVDIPDRIGMAAQRRRKLAASAYQTFWVLPRHQIPAQRVRSHEGMVHRIGTRSQG